MNRISDLSTGRFVPCTLTCPSAFPEWKGRNWLSIDGHPLTCRKRGAQRILKRIQPSIDAHRKPSRLLPKRGFIPLRHGESARMVFWNLLPPFRGLERIFPGAEAPSYWFLDGYSTGREEGSGGGKGTMTDSSAPSD